MNVDGSIVFNNYSKIYAEMEGSGQYADTFIQSSGGIYLDVSNNFGNIIFRSLSSPDWVAWFSHRLGAWLACEEKWRFRVTNFGTSTTGRLLVNDCFNEKIMEVATFNSLNDNIGQINVCSVSEGDSAIVFSEDFYTNNKPKASIGWDGNERKMFIAQGGSSSFSARQKMAYFDPSAGAGLYHSNSLKLQTDVYGVNIFGTLDVSGLKTSNTSFVWNDVGTSGFTFNVVIGNGARSGNYNTISIGRNASSTANSAITIGYGSSCSGGFSTALGYNSVVTASNEMRLGNSSTTVKLGNGTTVTSDKRDKIDISENELGLDFINSLKTVKWHDNNRDKYFKKEFDKETSTEHVIIENGVPVIIQDEYESGSRKGTRWHRGLVAQDVLELIDSKNFSAVKDTTVNNKDKHIEELTLDYNQFIAPMIKAIQEMSEKVKYLEEQLAKYEKGF